MYIETRKEINNMKNKFECPTQDFECPYWDWKKHSCRMYEETGDSPADECDEYMCYMEEDEE